MIKDIFTDEYFMRQALAEAQLALDIGEVPVGAIVVSERQIIAKAHNLTETLHDATAHAEMLALTAASEFLGSKYLDNCKMYVTIEPCAMCAGALAWAQLKQLVYAAKDPKRGYTFFIPNILHSETKVSSGLMAGEAGRLMSVFFEKLRL
ncbi:MAG: nucleoside deaminase [Chlorobi bacterium]|nr:nucleoside deaminase [Chlorobiota bacterium]